MYLGKFHVPLGKRKWGGLNNFCGTGLKCTKSILLMLVNFTKHKTGCFQNTHWIMYVTQAVSTCICPIVIKNSAT